VAARARSTIAGETSSAITRSKRSARAPVIRPEPQPTSTHVPPRGSPPRRPNSDSSSLLPRSGSPTKTSGSDASASQVARMPRAPTALSVPPTARDIIDVVLETRIRPRGAYSFALTVRLAGDATRAVRDSVLTCALEEGIAHAWQGSDGSIVV